MSLVDAFTDKEMVERDKVMSGETGMDVRAWSVADAETAGAMDAVCLDGISSESRCRARDSSLVGASASS
jgi:hypothetical protein